MPNSMRSNTFQWKVGVLNDLYLVYWPLCYFSFYRSVVISCRCNQPTVFRNPERISYMQSWSCIHGMCIHILDTSPISKRLDMFCSFSLPSFFLLSTTCHRYRWHRRCCRVVVQLIHHAFLWRGNIILGHRSIYWTTFHNLHTLSSTTETHTHANSLSLILSVGSFGLALFRWCIYAIGYAFVFYSLIPTEWRIWMRISFPNYISLSRSLKLSLAIFRQVGSIFSNFFHWNGVNCIFLRLSANIDGLFFHHISILSDAATKYEWINSMGSVKEIYVWAFEIYAFLFNV